MYQAATHAWPASATAWPREEARVVLGSDWSPGVKMWLWPGAGLAREQGWPGLWGETTAVVVA